MHTGIILPIIMSMIFIESADGVFDRYKESVLEQISIDNKMETRAGKLGDRGFQRDETRKGEAGRTGGFRGMRQ